MNAPCDKPARKPDAGNPLVRFDEGEGSVLDPLYSTFSGLPRLEKNPEFPATILFRWFDGEISRNLEHEDDDEHEDEFSISEG